MYKPTGLSEKIFKDRYAFTPEETWEQACSRVAKQMALAEIPEKQKPYEEKFNDILKNNFFVPGGRIWYNSGRNNPQLLNCFVLTNQLDSKEGWGEIARQMIVTSMTGGGCGADFSDVRPRGSKIGDQKGECPGPVELMRLIDSCAKPVRSGGQRRVALMFSLDLDHPDIEEFLDAKLVKGELTHANVSVRCKNTSEFIKAIKEDKNWELSWKGKYKKTIKAKPLWDKIVKNAYNSAEPGFLNWELVENESNISYIEKLVTTNPCQPSFAKLTLANGNEITMGELKEGDVLLNCNNKETIVLKKWSNGIKKVYAYGFDGGSFVGTENHQVVIKNYEGELIKQEIDLVYKNSHIVGVETLNGYKTLISKVYLGEFEVFDITVSDETHTYLTNGIYASNCGEIALSSYDCCCLGHLVLPRFINENTVNWELLADTIRSSVRFLDNVLSVNHYPLLEMKEKSHKLRRIGMGTTGLADALAMLGLKYGSEDANKFVDKLYKFIAKVSYESSVMLAVEKGMFPSCDKNKHITSDFMKRMPHKIRSLVKEHGIRNCAILTQAPTGTVSILSGNCSSGIEPMFASSYERRYWEKDERKTELVFHPLFDQFMREGKDVSHFVASHEISVEQHMQVQSIVQKWVDNAVSKTINMAEDYPIEDMEKNWLNYLHKLKGTTFYRNNTRGYVREDGTIEPPPLTPLSAEDAIKRFKETHTIGSEQAMECPSGVCSI